MLGFKSSRVDMSLSERVKEIVKQILAMEPTSYGEMLQLKPQLIDKGFTSYEVSEALNFLESIWLSTKSTNAMDLFNSDQDLAGGVLSEIEESVLSDSAKAFLLLLLEMEMISEDQLHYIIERAMINSIPPITLEDIQSTIVSCVNGMGGEYPDDVDDTGSVN